MRRRHAQRWRSGEAATIRLDPTPPPPPQTPPKPVEKPSSTPAKPPTPAASEAARTPEQQPPAPAALAKRASFAQIKSLQARTGKPIKQCKDALNAADGDEDKAAAALLSASAEVASKGDAPAQSPLAAQMEQTRKQLAALKKERDTATEAKTAASAALATPPAAAAAASPPTATPPRPPASLQRRASSCDGSTIAQANPNLPIGMTQEEFDMLEALKRQIANEEEPNNQRI